MFEAQTSPHPLDAIADKFRFIASTRYSRKSPLYRTLALGVAEDAEILALLDGVDLNKQVPNLLMGAVHYLLLKGEKGPIKAFYPSMTDIPRKPTEAYPAFREFCLEHGAQIRHIIRNRWVQVNEVQRCAMLLPALAAVSQRADGQPLSLLELGTSAGLLLNFDRYRYDYGERQLGDPNAPFTLQCEVRGDSQLPLGETFPQVADRLGVDINPLDLSDPDDVTWLRAVVWPDQPERLRRLDQAITLAQANPVRVVQGDARLNLNRLTDQLADDATLCIFWCALLKAARDVAHEHIADLARERPLYLISIEQQQIMLYDYADAQGQAHKIANVFGIGHWIEWLAD